MSKRRSVILSVVLEGRTQAQTARLYGVSESWVSKLVARWRAEGDTAFQARSRRPGSSPSKVCDETVELVVNLRSELSAQGLDAGPHTISWHLQQHHQITVSPSTIRRRLADLGLVEPNPKKRPKSSYVRFQADLPNEMWQSDFTHWRLAASTETEILTWLDDHSRCALSVTVHRRITGPIVVDTFNQTCADHGVPASTLTDNAMVYTTRHSGGKGGRNAFEARLAYLGTERKTLHPTTPPPAEKSNVSNKPSRNGSPREPPPTPTNCSSTNSPTPTTTTAPTAHSDVQPPPPSTTGSPKPNRAKQATQPTSESATTASRLRHTPPQQPTPPHRHRPPPRPHPRNPAGRRPRHQSRRNPNRRTSDT